MIHLWPTNYRFRRFKQFGSPVINRQKRSTCPQTLPSNSLQISELKLETVTSSKRHPAPTTTTGTINPGVIWSGKYFQIGVEAVIPINRQTGNNVGVLAQLHFYLDDLFPMLFRKPLLGDWP